MGADKEAKKAAKAEVKAAKAFARAAARVEEPRPDGPSATGMTAAERAAAAAERTVAINQRRLVVQVVSAIVAVLAVLITWWAYRSPREAGTPDVTVPAATEAVD
jgi:hypothetical protein